MVAAVSLALFVLVAALIRAHWTPLTQLDTSVADGLHDDALAHRGQLPVWRDVSAILSPAVLRIASVLVAIALFVWRRVLGPALVLGISVLGTLVLSPLTKLLVDRDRPDFAQPVAHAAGQSYPSGHALASFVAVAAVLVLCSPRVRRFVVAPGVLVVVAVGCSRLILGVHYLTDVLGGWLLGLAWLCLVVLAVDRLPLTTRVRA